MAWACGFLGFLAHRFKRTPSTTSSGFGEHPSHAHQLGERNQNGDRLHHRHSRGGRANSHIGLVSQAGNSSSPASPSEQESRTPLGAPYSGASQPSQSPQYDGEQQGSPVVATAAITAATQPATLVKLERGSTVRRTPLHIAAERGQLHVLSAIIESLCCAATATLLDAVPSSGGSGNASAGSNGADNGSNDGEAGRGNQQVTSRGSSGGRRFSRPDAVQPFEDGTSRRTQQQPGDQQHQGQSPSRGSLHHAHQGLGPADEFPATRQGPGGAPLAPEQYIQFHLNMQDADGTTALSLACRFGHVDCCRLLLANGSARTLPDARGNTPLHYAALRGHLGVLFMLLDEFLEPGQEEELTGYVDARNHAGCTPLHYAVWGRQSGSVQVLLQHGSDVLPRNSRPAQELTPPVMVVGSTPLHLAAARGHVEICRIILKTFAERVLEPLQLTEDDPQPPSLASLDPRVQVNANGHMPYQVAQRLGFYPLAMLLRPSIPILRLFSDEERAVRFYGPAPLRALAAEALNKKLLSELDALASQAATSAAGQQRRQLAGGPEAAVAVAGTTQTAASPGAAAAGSSGGDAGPSSSGSLRPVSAAANLEQLAAMEAEESAGAVTQGGDSAAPAGHTSPLPGAPSATSGSRAVSSGTGSGTERATAQGSGAAVSRRLTPPPLLQVDQSPSAGGVRSDPRDEAPATPHNLVLLPGPGPAGASGDSWSPQPAPPRTPFAAGSPGSDATPLSPAGISPRIMSPAGLGTSPQGLGPISPTTSLMMPAFSPHAQPHVMSGGSPSTRRSTPPLSSNRSSHAMLSAAPMVAGLSRPPSAPRANGQQSAQTSRGQVLVSLPGQPDIPELTPLETADMQPQSDQIARLSGEGALTAADDEGSMVDAALGGGAGSPGSVYVPRTPVRQPSSGALHVRRGSVSPQGASPTGVMGGSNLACTNHRISNNAGASTAVPTAGMSGEVGAATRRSGDGNRPPGLVRLRSNPLFDDAADGRPPHPAGPSSSTSASGGGGGSASAAASGGGSGGLTGMPSLAEDSAEGEDGSSSDATVASSCAAVSPFNPPRAADSSDSAGAVAGGPADGTSHQATAGTAAGSMAVAAVMSCSDDEEELECGVCMEPLPMVAISPCRHQVCGPCARRICCLNIQKPSHCPFCRATISAFVAPPPVTPS